MQRREIIVGATGAIGSAIINNIQDFNRYFNDALEVFYPGDERTQRRVYRQIIRDFTREGVELARAGAAQLQSIYNAVVGEHGIIRPHTPRDESNRRTNPNEHLQIRQQNNEQEYQQQRQEIEAARRVDDRIRARDRARLDARDRTYPNLRGEAQDTSMVTRQPNEIVNDPTTQQPEAARAAGAGSPTVGGRHGETGVDMINYTKFHPFKRTEQVLMPFFFRGQYVLSAGQNFAAHISWRLNSIFDIITTTGYTAIDPNVTPVTADQPDGINSREVPGMREYWKQFYNYWHVVKCEWQFYYRSKNLIIPAADTANQDRNEYQLFFYEHGLQIPPLSQTIGTQQLIPWYIRKYHPHVRKANIKQHVDDDHLGETWQVMKGTFRPGDIQHEVCEDEFTRTWHKWDTVPPTAEKLTIMLQRQDHCSTNASYEMDYYMEMQFTVQLKDLKAQYEFITEATGIPQITNIADIKII